VILGLFILATGTFDYSQLPDLNSSKKLIIINRAGESKRGNQMDVARVQSAAKGGASMDHKAPEASMMFSAPVECHLCAEVQSRLFPKQYSAAYGVESRICYETEDLFVVPSVSPLSSGHVLILPREHLTRLSDLPEASLRELYDCVDFVERRLSVRFGSSLYFFEHGVKRGQMACGIDHAHLHVVNLPGHIIATVERDVSHRFPSDADGTLHEVLRAGASRRNESYLVHGQAVGSLCIAFNEHVPSQYVRRRIAKASGRSDWDWKLVYGRPEFLDTCDAFNFA
jgi:ATP adenylyltransferase